MWGPCIITIVIIIIIIIIIITTIIITIIIIIDFRYLPFVELFDELGDVHVGGMAREVVRGADVEVPDL